MRAGRRAGVLLDVIVAGGLILLGSYALFHFFGLTLTDLLTGARQFFGV